MGVNSLPWYYIEALPEVNETATLSGEEWHHCLHVLRMKAGESLILFNGSGKAFEGIIRQAGKANGIIELMADRSEDFPTESRLHINIAFAPTKSPDRMEVAIEKIVELGIHSVTFLDCIHGERSRIRLDRVHKIMIGAAKQSRKSQLPILNDLISPLECVEKFRRLSPNIKIFCCHLDETSRLLHYNYHGEDDVLILIGPEGGFDPGETEEMKTAGAMMTSLGSYRLRVETAVITACAQLHILHAMNHP